MTTEEIYIPQATTTEFELTCDDTGLSYELEDEVLIGRDLSCHIRLASTAIAGRHAKISQSEDGIFLEDLAPDNTTLLNGSRIGHGAWITLGDQIDLNGTIFSVRAKNTSNAHSLPVKKAPKPSQPNPSSSYGAGQVHAQIKAPDAATITSGSKPTIQAGSHNSSPNNLNNTPTQSTPLTNQDVVEAARALEERAKARLQQFKKGNSDALSLASSGTEKAQTEKNTAKESQPNWESLVTIDKSTATQSSKSTIQSPTPNQTSKGAAKAKGATPNKTAPDVVLKPLPEPEKAPTKELDDFDAANDNLNADEHAKVLQAIEAEETKPAAVARKQTNPATGAGAGPRLVVQTAPTRGKSYHLALTDAKNTWTVGYSKDVDIQINENAIDGVHAIVEEMNGKFKISTTRTTNGMLVNEKFKDSVILKHGDIVQFGRMTFQFRTDSPAINLTDTHSSTKLNYGSMIAGLVILGSLLTALLVAPK